MAENKVNGSFLPTTLGGWLGWIVSLVIAAGAVLVNWRKGKADATSMIMERWQELYDRHAQDIKDLREELRAERETSSLLRRSLEDAHGKIADLSQRLAEMERRHSEELIHKDQEIAGLKRQLAQHGESGIRLGGVSIPEDSETLKAISRSEERALRRITDRAKRKDPK